MQDWEIRRMYTCVSLISNRSSPQNPARAARCSEVEQSNKIGRCQAADLNGGAIPIHRSLAVLLPGLRIPAYRDGETRSSFPVFRFGASGPGRQFHLMCSGPLRPQSSFIGMAEFRTAGRKSYRYLGYPMQIMRNHANKSWLLFGKLSTLLPCPADLHNAHWRSIRLVCL